MGEHLKHHQNIALAGHVSSVGCGVTNLHHRAERLVLAWREVSRLTLSAVNFFAKTKELTDAQGQIVWSADYKVWGEAKVWQGLRTGTDGWAGRMEFGSEGRVQMPALEQPFRFQRQQFDEETGLHYNRYRYYDPVVGRFVSQDPIGLAGADNTYLIAINPMVWIDPLGLSGRSGAFRKEKRDAGIPNTQQPDSVRKVPLTNKGCSCGIARVDTREYLYMRDDRSKMVIQDHGAGHNFGDGGVGDQGPHFNVRPIENTRTGSIPGTKSHYPF